MAGSLGLKRPSWSSFQPSITGMSPPNPPIFASKPNKILSYCNHSWHRQRLFQVGIRAEMTMTVVELSGVSLGLGLDGQGPALAMRVKADPTPSGPSPCPSATIPSIKMSLRAPSTTPGALCALLADPKCPDATPRCCWWQWTRPTTLT